MQKVYTKTVLAIFMAAAGIFIILYHQKIQNKSIKRTELVRGVFTKINLDITNIQYNILKSNYYLYYNNDEFYKKSIDIQKQFRNLLKQRYILQDTYTKTESKIEDILKNLKIFDADIINFMSLNAILKNSNTILPKYSMRVNKLLDHENKNEAKIIDILVKINFSLFIMKNGVDKTFIKGLKRHTSELMMLLPTIKEQNKRDALLVIIKHLGIFTHVFPQYVDVLNKILNTKLKNEVKSIEDSYMYESMLELKTVNKLDNFLLMLYLGGIAIIIYFIFNSEKENRTLQRLYEKLRESYVKDHLTELKNKKSFDMDLKEIEFEPSLVLINIDKFSHINDFFGLEIGDLVLVESAKIIDKFSSGLHNSSVYRFGGDEFGILFECRDECKIESVSSEIIDYFETHTLQIKNTPIDISISIGANSGKEKLFEKAEIALLKARKSTRRRFFVYNESLDIADKIEKNIYNIKRLKHAILTKNIIPYFQPIVDIKSNKIVKYEALARLRDKDGKILSPFFFIDVANEVKLSGVITIMMLESILKIARESSYNFSVNFSADDILDSQDSKKILQMIKENKDIAKQITFEILESHEMTEDDYDIVIAFTKELKSYGCEIAIDDFGSGYSNFEKLLKLDIDILKIDGTLVKNIDKDKDSELIVQTMIDFAKNAGIEVVAEFVHSKDVLGKIVDLDCDYAQGYYLGEPEPMPRAEILNV